MSVLASYEYKDVGILLCVVDVCGFVCVSLVCYVCKSDLHTVHKSCAHDRRPMAERMDVNITFTRGRSGLRTAQVASIVKGCLESQSAVELYINEQKVPSGFAE